MKKVSDKQAKKNRILSEIKKLLPRTCYISGLHGDDLAHVIPKSLFPQYYCEEWNLVVLNRDVHNEYDSNREFRKKQTDLFERVIRNVKEEDKGLVRKYFGLI